MAAEPTKAIYVRVPAGLADRLDRVSERLGMSKRDIITRLVGDRLEVEDALQPMRIWEDDKTRTAGHIVPTYPVHPDVLSLEEAATMLRVEPDDIKEMAEAGDLPGRKVGSQWRFSRTALMNWLQAQ
jgi:excisionase family DNA binding protein